MGKIDWLKNPDGTQGKPKNYAFGCNRKCLYGYCWRIARRFGMAERMAKCEMKFKYGKNYEIDIESIEYLQLVNDFRQFIPTFRPSVMAQKLPKKPTMIFFSMSDPAYWKEEWYKKILEKIRDHRQHTFVILTKSPGIYKKFTFPHNTWIGVTITTDMGLFKNISEIRYMAENTVNTTFISFEPLLGRINFEKCIKQYLEKNIDWVIVGPETGRRKNRVIAQPDWIEPFYDLNTPVFMKEACKQVLGEHGKGKCEKVHHGTGGEYGHMPHDDSEYLSLDANYIKTIRCGRCHGRKLRQEWPKGYMKKQDEYGRKECSKERPYDYKGGQWYHPYAKVTDANYDYMSEYYCPVCDLTFTVTIGD